jgi:predicted metalloendopeptidase
MGKHSRHHHHHHAKHAPVHDDFSWLWIIFILLIVGVVLVIFLVPWSSESYEHHYYDPVKEAFQNSEQPSNTPFVFRKKNIRVAQKRGDRAKCKAGEQWSPEENMCAPIFNTPSSFEGSIMNITANMCDDFFGSMCGRWNAEHINEDRTFSYGYHRNQEAIKRLILDNKNKEIRAFYDSCVSSLEGRQKHESELEVKHVMEHIAGALKSYGDLPTVFGRLNRYGFTSPFVFSIERDPLEKRLLPFFTADSFNFSSSIVSNTLRDSQSIMMYPSLVMLDKIRRANKVIQALTLHNTEPVEQIVDYMSYLKDGGFQDDVHTFQDLGVWHTPFENKGGWTNYFQALDGSALRLSTEQPVWIVGMPYMKWLLKEGIGSLEVLDWLAFVEFSILYNARQFIPNLPNNVYFRQEERHHKMYKPVGKREASSNSTILNLDKCIRITQHMIPGLVAQTFLTNMMPQKERIRTEVRSIIENIINVYKGLIQLSKWLSQMDKDSAFKKLNSIIVRVIEPDEWSAEPFAQRISADRYDHNMNLVRRYRMHRNLQLWHKDNPDGFDRNELAFFVAPLSDVNAYYSPSSNTITILAGILQKPFYNVDYDDVTKYSIIGSIIGHELGHMFDSSGIYWDENGSFKASSIWSREGLVLFKEKTKCVVREYNDTPAGCDVPADFSYGESTLGEDMADLVGIRLSFKAYFDNHPSANSGQKQYFFMNFAQAWCSSYEPDYMCDLIREDVHAIAEYRVDRTLRNTQEFLRVFGCTRQNQLCSIYE